MKHDRFVVKQFLFLFLLLLLSLQSGFAATTYTISGIVKDSGTGETLPGVTVRLEPGTRGVITNIGGFYSLPTIHPGSYTLQYSFIGYTTITRTVGVTNAPVILNIALTQNAFELNEVVVEGEREKQQHKMTVGEINLTARQLSAIPKIAEPDLFRTLQQLPGILAVSDFSTGLNVWGGSSDQNLILLDGTDVYNPSHLGGIFSTFNMDAIKDATLIKGAYPAEYGGRLSSVLSVWDREGNREHFQGKASWSVLATTATLEGPAPHGSWLLSGRRTYIDLFTAALKRWGQTSTDLPYYFYDAQGKYNYDFANGDKLSPSGYFGRDVLHYSDTYGTSVNVNWGNKTFSLPYVKILSPKFYTRSQISASEYDSQLNFTGSGTAFNFTNGVTDYTAKFDVHHFPNQYLEVKFGHESKFLNFFLHSFGQNQSYANINESSYLGSFYLQTKYDPNPLLSIQPGIRYSYFLSGNYQSVEPRFSIKYRTTTSSAITFAYGHYRQFINLAAIGGGSNGFLSIIDIWAPVDKTLAPGTSDHYTVSYETNVGDELNLTLEGYYKNYDHMVEFKNKQNDRADLSSQFYQGRGWAWGFDELLRKDYGNWTGWLGYGFGVTKRSFPEIDNGQSFYPKWDRRNDVNFVNTFRTSPRGELNVRWTYGTGQPYTIATGRYLSAMPNDPNSNMLISGYYNNARLTPYHRLDVGYTVKYTKSWGTIAPFIEIINLYNRHNIFSINYDFTQEPPKQTEISQLPLLPTFGFTATF